jgi:Cu(I)/Ag(I) efflux system membrane protein CusA/SilA
LPPSARSALGPDATGVGWVYEYALVDRSGRHDLSQLRSAAGLVPALRIEDRAGVAEVASIGGMVKQYQVLLDPVKLAAYGVTHQQVVQAIATGQSGSRAARCSSWPRPNTWSAPAAI